MHLVKSSDADCRDQIEARIQLIEDTLKALRQIDKALAEWRSLTACANEVPIARGASPISGRFDF